MSLQLFRARPLLQQFRRLASASLPPTNLEKTEKGFFSYQRNYSRDPVLAHKFSPPQKGDLPSTFMLRRLGHAYEVYPLIVLTGIWFVFFCYAVYWSFNKIEIHLARSKSKSPMDWERAREDYWKRSTIAFDFDGRTRKRVPLMEMLQDEMLEAAKKRGTR